MTLGIIHEVAEEALELLEGALQEGRPRLAAVVGVGAAKTEETAGAAVPEVEEGALGAVVFVVVAATIHAKEGRQARMALAALVGARRVSGFGSFLSVVTARPARRVRYDGFAVPAIEKTHLGVLLQRRIYKGRKYM